MSKKLAENQLALGTKYESLIESANRLALGIEDDHNLISGLGEKTLEVRGLGRRRGRRRVF